MRTGCAWTLRARTGAKVQLEDLGGIVPVRTSDEDLAVELIDQCDTLVQPGYFYDFESEGYLVLSLITPQQEFAEGLRRLLQFVSIACGPGI